MSFKKISQNTAVTNSTNLDKDFITFVRNISGSVWENLNIKFSDFLKLFTVNIEWEIFFYEVFDEVELIHEVNMIIKDVISEKAITVQYSLDDGASWVNYTTDLSVSAGTSRWRVSNFGTYSNGTVIIKAIES